MAERLPVVGGDDGSWGTVLNNWLLKEHYDTNDGNTNAANGTHKGVTIRAGSSSVAPLTFTTTAATLLTTPAAGALEVDSSGLLYYTQTTGSGNRRRVMYYDASSAATGDIFYRDSSGDVVRLGIGSSNYVLTVNSGLPSWQPASGGGAPTNAQYVTLATDGTLSAERVLTGTSNKITVTDGGAGSTVTLNIGTDVVTLTDTQTLSSKTLTTPKIVDTGSIIDGNGNEYVKFSQTTSAVNEITVTNAATTTAPQISSTGNDSNIDLKLAGKGTGKIAPQSHINMSSKDVYFTEYSIGNSGTAPTINWGNGQKQSMTLDNTSVNLNTNWSAPPGPGNYLLRLIQGSGGSKTIGTWPTNFKWPGGTAPTLSTAASAIDIVSFYYDGTNYYAAANLNFS